MHKTVITILTVLVSLSLAVTPPIQACTNYLITPGASEDGSTMITYAADAHVFYGELYFLAGATFPEGSMREIIQWDGGKRMGEIPQVPRTWTRVGNINERQVAVGETTWGGRKELRDPEAVMDYGSLMYIALERAATAREAIQVMTDLVAEYGYASSGESFSISDPREAWILDMISKGPGNKGAVWVARRVPDGYISGHANAPRIRQFPLNDPDNTIYSPDVISFAREQGWFDGKDEDFSFADTYSPDAFGKRRFCDARVWCMFKRAAPSKDLPAGWVLGEQDAEPVPLWIKPDRKLTVADVMRFMRDHFQGTELDMTTDPGAGPYGLPYRWRPLTWKVGEEEYFNERAVSTQQTGFSFVAQSRSDLPDPIGGVLWYGVDDTNSTLYFPVYAGVTAVPHAFAQGTGGFHDVDLDAAFWRFNQVSNFAYLRYSDMIVDIQKVQQELEGRFLADQAEVDQAAVALMEQSPRLAREYLTDYTRRSGETVMARWKELSDFLLYKYLDGNVKDAQGNVTHPGYPDSWYENVAASTGDRLQMRRMEAELALKEVEKAKAKELAEAVLTLLDGRGVAVDQETRTAIQAVEDPGKVQEMLVQAATVDDAAELIIEK
jgi:dipeptidase